MHIMSLMEWADAYAERLAAYGYSVIYRAGEQGVQSVDLENDRHVGCIVWWPWIGCEFQLVPKRTTEAIILVHNVPLESLLSVLEERVLL